MTARGLHVLATCLVLAILAGLTGAAFVYSGIYDVSAIQPHTRPVYRMLLLARDRAIERHSRDVPEPPPPAADRTRLGFALYAEHCVRCHGAPGVAPEAFALGLEPAAMPLAQSGRELDARALYWIVRNGIKMTAMPAFAFRVDDAGLWALVAAVETLPHLTPSDYAALAPVTSPAAAEEDITTPEPDVARGRVAVGQYGCTACHAFPGWPGRDARTGPPLHDIGARATIGGVLTNTPANMVRWLRSPQTVTPLTAMPNLGVSERDARDMAAYLSTLR